MDLNPRDSELIFNRNVAVNEVLRSLLGEVDAHIWVVSLWEKANEAAVQSCMTDMLEALSAFDLSRESISPTFLNSETWQPDCEPAPSEADTWIRGAVPRRTFSPSTIPLEGTSGTKPTGRPKDFILWFC